LTYKLNFYLSRDFP